MNDNDAAHAKKSFTIAYKAYEKHYGAGASDFSGIAVEFGETSKGNPFLAGLLAAVYNKLASDYKRREATQ